MQNLDLFALPTLIMLLDISIKSQKEKKPKMPTHTLWSQKKALMKLKMKIFI